MSIAARTRRAAAALAAALALALLVAMSAPAGGAAQLARRLGGSSAAAAEPAASAAAGSAAAAEAAADASAAASAKSAEAAVAEPAAESAAASAHAVAAAEAQAAEPAPESAGPPPAAEAMVAEPQTPAAQPAEEPAAPPPAAEPTAMAAASPTPQLRGSQAKAAAGAAVASSNLTSAVAGGAPCLCLFDIDRTLTSCQGQACPGSRLLPGVWDDAYGGGDLRLSPLGAGGVRSTACGGCALGAVSHGEAGGQAMKDIIRQALGSPSSSWSHPGDIDSPLVLGCAYKPPCVQGVLNWYNRQGAGIAPENVFFFDDKGSNVRSFYGSHFNAKQVSCASPDGGKGLCGASPGEIRLEHGVSTC